MSRFSEHNLLETLNPAYSNITVRRAFIVWLHCGQINNFRDVCKYFHYLESLEDQLTVETRTASRHLEFDLFTNPPPSSSYLTAHHPKLYVPANIEDYQVDKVDELNNGKRVLKLEGFEEVFPKNGATKQDVINASQLIRQYCISHTITLRKFLSQFKEFAIKSNLKNNVLNVYFYVKRMMIKEEITMIADCPTTFSFIDDDCLIEDESVNALIRKIRLLDSIKLSPTLKVHSTDTWGNESAKEMTQVESAIGKKSSRNENVTPTTDLSKVDSNYNSVLVQKFKDNLECCRPK